MQVVRVRVGDASERASYDNTTQTASYRLSLLDASHLKTDGRERLCYNPLDEVGIAVTS